MALGSLINRLLAPLGLRLHRRPSGLGRTGLSRQGEEAVIQDLIQGLEIEPYFVDVGAGDGAKDSNTARLALGGWQGVFFECDAPTLAVLAANCVGLDAVVVSGARVTPVNVAGLLEGYGVPRDFGLLSLDIDSYDHHVLASLLEHFRPTIIVAESQFDFAFDINRNLIRTYEHLGPDLGRREAKQFAEKLTAAIEAILADEEAVDSPLYTFLPQLDPPSMGHEQAEEAPVMRGFSPTPKASAFAFGEAGAERSTRQLVDQARQAMAGGDHVAARDSRSTP